MQTRETSEYPGVEPRPHITKTPHPLSTATLAEAADEDRNNIKVRCAKIRKIRLGKTNFHHNLGKQNILDF